MPSDGFLFTDHYQLTMAQLYHRYGLAERRALFDYVFRSYPDYGSHRAGYCVTAGLGPLLDWMGQTRMGETDRQALAAVRSGSGQPLFADGFLDWLLEAGTFRQVTLRAVPEGRIVHARTPVATVEAPLAIAQILETPLLNQLNYPTLVATKASRAVEAAGGGDVIDFGMRRAPGSAANAAARAALIGGAVGSSNFGMSHQLGSPPKGTHGHSMIQVFMALAGGEVEAFRAYADLYPDDCVLLVDTIDTLESGVPNAITVFQELRRRGHKPKGVRLDSGDLAHLAVRTAAMLDEAGFEETSIVLSTQLDELTIWQIRNQITDEAPRYGVDAGKLLDRLAYGVGSRMAASYGAPYLDGVFKLVAAHGEAEMVPAIKISETPAKIPIPGRKSLWRIYDRRGRATADLITLDSYDPNRRPLELVHPMFPDIHRSLRAEQVSEVEPLQQLMLDRGRRVFQLGGVAEAQSRRAADLERLDPGVRRLVNPHIYHVSLSPGLSDLKQKMLADFRASG